MSTASTRKRRNCPEFGVSELKQELLQRFLKDQEELLNNKQDQNNNIPEIVVLSEDKNILEGNPGSDEDSDVAVKNLDNAFDNAFDEDLSRYSSCSSVNRYSVNSNYSPFHASSSTDLKALKNGLPTRRRSLGVSSSNIPSIHSFDTSFPSHENIALNGNSNRTLLQTVDPRDRRRLSCDIAELTRSLNESDQKLNETSSFLDRRRHSLRSSVEKSNDGSFLTISHRKCKDVGSGDNSNKPKYNTLPPILRKASKK